MANYSQRYNASTQTTTAGAFKFDTITSVDWPVAKVIWGDEGTATYASASNPLPVTISGVSTAALQTTGNGILTTIDADTGNIATSVASIDTKTPALGQALAAASVPVVLTAAQLSTLTPPAAITGFALESGGNLAAIATDAAAIETLLTTIESNQLADGHNVTIDNASIAVTDNSGSLTVDAPVGTPVFVRLSDGSSAISTLPVSVSGVSTLAEQQSQTTHLGRIAGKYVDFDTGGGTDSVVALGILLPGSGGAAIGGTSSNPIRTDPTGTTAQPITDNGGSVTVDAPVGTPVFVRLSDGASAVAPALETGGNLAAAATSLNVMDDWDESDRAKVNTIAGQAGVQGGSGTVSANTQRVVLATDVALPTGTNSIGQVTANAGTNLNTSALALESGGNLADIKTSVQLIDDAVVTNGGAAGKYIGLAAWDDSVSGAMQRLQMDGNSGGLLVSVTNTPLGVTGAQAHDVAGSITSAGLVPIAARASATAPSDVSHDNDAVVPWHDRKGAAVVVGGIPHDSTDALAPVKIGARAAATLSDDTMVANADRTDAVSDLDGAIITRSGFPLGDLISERVTNTDGNSTAFSNFGATASTRSFITAIVVYNSSATPGTIDFRDGTGGSVLYTVPIPGTGGAVITNGGVPLFCTTANTALAYDVSAALSTVTISISGFKSKARA